MKQTHWAKNYTTLIAATTIGCIGSIAGEIATFSINPSGQNQRFCPPPLLKGGF